ncbi:MAG: PfkB family carbohydrate kinase [Acidimicrobiales bacterium]
MLVLVVGAVNVDLVVGGLARLPAPGETVAGDGLRTFGGGKGANAAVAAARAGAPVALVAAVGADAHGDGALDGLRADGVDCSGVAVLADQSTGVALILVDGRGENLIALGPGANGALPAEHVTAALGERLAGAGCVVVSTEIPGPVALAAVTPAVTAGVPCILNPAPVTPEVVTALAAGDLAGVILTPNATELGQLAPDGDTAEERAATLARRTGAPVVVTLGGDGCLVAQPDGTTETLPAHPVEVVDTTGAGDTFTGVLAARLAAGADLGAAAATAVAAASLSVTAAGARTGMPTAAALAPYL